MLIIINYKKFIIILLKYDNDRFLIAHKSNLRNSNIQRKYIATSQKDATHLQPNIMQNFEYPNYN